MAGRLGLLSHHVVLYQYPSCSCSSPVFAIVLIQEELIEAVHCISPDRQVPLTQVQDVLCEYADWNPIYLEDLYISPGMIDFNMYRNDAWESLTELSQAAVSGGVTFVAEERDDDLHEAASELHCDVGLVQVLSPYTEPEPEIYLGVKGYLTCPRPGITPITDLSHWLQSLAPFQCPVLVDVALVDESLIFYSSPGRLLPPEERSSAVLSGECRVFAGGFNADEDSSRSSSSESASRPLPTRQTYHRSQAPAVTRVSAHIRPKSWDFNKFKSFIRSKSRKHTAELPNRTQSEHNIVSALQAQILLSAGKRESLMKAEMMQYMGEGKTMFLTSRSTVLPELEPLENSPDVPAPRKVAKRARPNLIVTTKPTVPHDSVYLFHLAQYPDSMEVRGIDALLSAFQSPPCPLHICNLSSATAIARIQQARESGCRVTCETCPHFLFFTDESIEVGDTRFKNFPPIRNTANCNFLWELLTMNQIQTVCSQHRAIPGIFKCKPSFKHAMSGINGLGFTLQVLWTLLRRPFPKVPEHYLVRLAKWTAHNPAQVLNLPKRGSIAAGMYADLVIWDPFASQTFHHTYSSQVQQCPYLGVELYGVVRQVYVRGRLAFDQGSCRSVGKLVLPKDER